MKEKYGEILFWDEMSESGEIQSEDGLLYEFDVSSCILECQPEEGIEVLFCVSEDDEVETISAA